MHAPENYESGRSYRTTGSDRLRFRGGGDFNHRYTGDSKSGPGACAALCSLLTRLKVYERVDRISPPESFSKRPARQSGASVVCGHRLFVNDIFIEYDLCFREISNDTK
jgi:hypothetical protein